MSPIPLASQSSVLSPQSWALTRRARATRALWLLAALALAATGQASWLLGSPPFDGILWYSLAVVCFLRADQPGPSAPSKPSLIPKSTNSQENVGVGLKPAPTPTHPSTTDEVGDAGVADSVLPRPESLPVQAAPYLDRRGLAFLTLGAGAILVGIARAAAEQTAAALALPYVSGILFIMVAVTSRGGLRWPPSGISSLLSERRVPWAALGLVGVCLLAALLRFFRLDQLPAGIWYDEALIGLEAARVLADATFRPLYSYVSFSPAVYTYALAGSMALFGQDITALRFVSAGAGVLTVVAWCFLLREGFSVRVALAGALLLAVSRWDLTFSRLALQGVTTPLFEVAVLALLLAALRRGSLPLAAAAGIVLGVGLGFYVAFLAFLLVIGGYLSYRIVAEPGFWTQARAALGIFVATAFLAGLPVVAFATLDPQTFGGRVVQASAAGDGSGRGLVTTLTDTTLKHLLMFHREGDHNGRHNLPGAPMLDPVTGVLALLGLGWSLRHPRQPFSVLGVLWLFIMLLPGVLSVPFEAPQGLRAIGALPAALLFATLGLDRLWRTSDEVGPKRRRQTAAVAIGTLALITVLNVDTYFRRQAQNPDAWAAHSTAETVIGKRLALLPPDRYDVYLSGLYRDHPTIEFLAGPRSDVRTFVASAHLPLRTTKEGVLLFLEPREDYAYRLVTKYYPGAPCEHVSDSPGMAPPTMYACAVSAAQIAAAQGLDRTVISAEGRTSEREAGGNEAVKLLWGAGEMLAAPLDALWAGALHIPESGSYRFRAAGDGAMVVTVDGERVLDSPLRFETIVDLAQGLHKLEVSAKTSIRQGFLRLLWQPPGEPWQPLPASQVFHTPVATAGLTGSYYTNPRWEGSPAFRRVDPIIALYFHLVPLARPYSVEWTGSLVVAEPGRYLLGLRAISTASLMLQDTSLVEVTAPGQQREREVSLNAGVYRVRLRFRDQDGYSHVYLLWRKPGAASLEPIPSDALRPW